MDFKVKEELKKDEVVKVIENLIGMVEDESAGASVHVIENFSVDQLRKLIYETTPEFEFKGEFNMPDPKEQIKILLDNMEQGDLIITFDAERTIFSTTFYVNGRDFSGWSTTLTMFLAQLLHKHLDLEYNVTSDKYLELLLNNLNKSEEMRRKFSETGDEGFVQYVNEKLSDPTNRFVSDKMVDNKIEKLKLELNKKAEDKIEKEDIRDGISQMFARNTVYRQYGYQSDVNKRQKELKDKVLELFGEENKKEIKGLSHRNGYVRFHFKNKYDLLKKLDTLEL
jgi:hypothetical protein